MSQSFRKMAAFAKYAGLAGKSVFGLEGIPGAVAIVTNRDNTQFLLQEKGMDHPFRSCRGKLSLFGGSLNRGESPRLGVARELREEFPHLFDVVMASGALVPFKAFKLPGRQYLVNYRVTVFVATLNNEAFHEVLAVAETPGSVHEGNAAVVVGRAEMEMVVRDKERWLGSLEVPVSEWLRTS